MGWLEAYPWLNVVVVLIALGVVVAIWKGARPQWVAILAERRAARRRAEALLREHLSAEQYRQLLEDGYLEVPSRLYPGRRYRIPRGPGRVQVYEGGRAIGSLCVVTRDPVPQADLVLTLKWLIEGDEQAYLSIANWINRISLWDGRLGA